MGDTTALQASVVQLKGDVAALLAAQPGAQAPDDQADIDAITGSVQALSAEVVAATPVVATATADATTTATTDGETS
jgi:hypothetical protein